MTDTLPTVECTIHGPMHWRPGPDWWECLGFDGEGCGRQLVYAEDAALRPTPGSGWMVRTET
jgi:hypothetical protein